MRRGFFGRGRGRVGAVGTLATLVSASIAVLWPTVASAEDHAVIAIPRDRYAEPPSGYPYRGGERSEPIEPRDERVVSPFRLQVGPWVATTGRGLAPGVGVAADMGRGTIGGRLMAVWTRGEPSSGDPTSASPIGGGIGQYTGEVTIDFVHRGPLHPVLGLGFGYARVDTGHGAGDVGIGTARLGLEYALAMDDADVRVALGALGALPGPEDATTKDVKGWGMVGLSVGIGF